MGHCNSLKYTSFYFRPHSYTSILLTPSYRVTERETVQGVAKAAVKDFARLIQKGICKDGKILLLMADGTHKNKSNSSMTGPWFLDVQHDEEVASLLKRYGHGKNNLQKNADVAKMTKIP